MTPRPTLRLEDGDLCWTPDGVRTPERRPFTEDDAARLAGWNVPYRDARRKADVLADVGREIYEWLDGDAGWLARALGDARPTWLVEFAAGVQPGKDEALFLEARLSVAFMAASPTGQHELAFEDEEAALLAATGKAAGSGGSRRRDS